MAKKSLEQENGSQSFVKKKVICIAGPTCVGKTALSLMLAKAIPSEIVSADAMQVYRNMNIGTAKITRNQMQGVPHHVIDIRDVANCYNVAEFYKDAMKAIKDIHAKGKTPIIVGGNGFYIRSLLFGPPEGPPSQKELREELTEHLEKRGPEFMFEKLNEFDPEYAKTITPLDSHKILRALEIIALTSKKVSDIHIPCADDAPKDIEFHCYFLFQERAKLYARIEQRCEEMMQEGLIEEVEKLLSLGITNNPSASASIGYRQVIEYLQLGKSKDTLDECIKAFKTASRRYAKRQFTWFNAQPMFTHLDIDIVAPSDIVSYILSKL